MNVFSTSRGSFYRCSRKPFMHAPLEHYFAVSFIDGESSVIFLSGISAKVVGKLPQSTIGMPCPRFARILPQEARIVHDP